MTTSNDESSLRQLFGGAISMAIPNRFEDVSQIRDVPDTQEVSSAAATGLKCHSRRRSAQVLVDVHTDQSVIVELLVRHEEVEDARIAEFQFEALASDNDSQSSSIFFNQPLDSSKLPNYP
jgi:hypothetical protein